MENQFLFFKFNNRHRAVFDLIKSHRKRLYFAIACMIVLAAADGLIAYLVKPVVDEIFVNKDIEMLITLPLIVMSVFTIKSIAMYGQEYLLNYVGQHIIMQLRNLLYDCIQDLPLSFFHHEKTGVLMSRVINDVGLVREMVSSAISGSVRDFFKVVFFAGVIIYMDWELALVALSILPLAFFPVVILGKKVRKFTRYRQETMADLSSFLHETFLGNKVVKAFGMESYEKGRFNHRSRKLLSAEMKNVQYKATLSPIMELLGALALSIVIVYGGYKVIKGTSTPGTFFAFMTAMLSFYGPIKQISKLNNKIQQGMTGVDRIFQVLETPSDITEVKHPEVITEKPHRVIFKGVSFSYGEQKVLSDVSIDVAPGKVLAIVGPSGGGKTTLVNLIPRFYDTCEGKILIDGIDIKKASIDSLRRQIAIVTQEPILFNDTIRNNIAYGVKDASDDAIVFAAKSAYAYDFIMGFSKQFDTTIGELGNRLSGGEKQRICIARALLKNAPILILDEATAALDASSERWVQKALENLMKGRTTFVIAHRLSTIKNADHIIVMKKGRIVEEGNEEELLQKKGVYDTLYQMQFKNSDGER